MAEQLRTTEAHLTVKTSALEEIDRKLAQEKAELEDLMSFIDARDKLAGGGQPSYSGHGRA
jgi:hypothetical protein